MKFRRLSLLLLSAIMVFVLAACGGGNGNSGNGGKAESTDKPVTEATNAAKETAAPDDGALDHSKPLKLTVFSTTANYAGPQTGWFAKVIKDKFNIELDIVASNLTAWGHQNLGNDGFRRSWRYHRLRG